MAFVLCVAAGCSTSFPDTYEGDFSEFFEAKERAEEEKFIRQLERESILQKKRENDGRLPIPEITTPLISLPPLPEGAEVRLDGEIARDVRKALAENDLLRNRKLAVTVQGGIVTLQGLVKVPSESMAAVFEVTKVEGVRGVYDLTELYARQEVGAEVVLDSVHVFSTDADWGELRKLSWSDHEVERAVVGYFDRTPEVDAIDIEVSVENRLVVLRGRVSTAKERQAAGAIAKKISRRLVRNELEVSPIYDPVRPRKEKPY